jgi:hypothetical protein
MARFLVDVWWMQHALHSTSVEIEAASAEEAERLVDAGSLTGAIQLVPDYVEAMSEDGYEFTAREIA